ncbi:unnamed protein product [Symbiodinium microadriaticum]|nr:unnamed protein product [Symbiodinium microadriaticum]CAE7451567.1 unnamed protein product [Symbiodinium sp. KB8]
MFVPVGWLMAATAAVAISDSPQTFQCTSVASPCDCADGFKCCNTSTSKGVKNREDAEHCCCPASDELLFASAAAVCVVEAKKCQYTCCEAGMKLCGSDCCDASAKCGEGKCGASTATTPSSGCSQRSWWEIVPGEKVWSFLLEFMAVPAAFCGAGVFCSSYFLRRRARLALTTPRPLRRLGDEESSYSRSDI